MFIMPIHLVLGVVVVGLIHGLEPGHGWPLAIMFSLGRVRPLLYGFLAALIISFFHFLSTAVVVLAFLFLNTVVEIPATYLDPLAAALLIGLGIYIFMRHGDDDHVVSEVSLRRIAYIAFLLGFAHEEEFMLIGLILTGLDPIILIIAYSGAVTLSIMLLTLIGIKAYEKVRERVEGVEDHLRLIASASLILMGLSILLTP